MFFSKTSVALCCVACLAGPVLAQTNSIENEAALKLTLDQQVAPLMAQAQIPGMAVAVLWQGKIFHYSYGMAEVATKKPVTPDTIFELGSVSKTFGGVIGGMALAKGDIQLDDPVAKHWPALTAPQWQQINLQHLATYTAGGLPLQLPDSVTDKASLLSYYQQWQPQYQPGTQRVYANSSIGLFAHLAVAAAKQPYAEAFQQLTADLGLSHTYLQVPKQDQAQYAWGYNNGKPVHIGNGVLLDEAGGVKASVRDLARWVQLNMQPNAVGQQTVRAGMQLAQQRYAKAGQMFQGLGWEMLDYPLAVSALEAMTDADFVAGSKAGLLQPAAAAKPDSWVHKTGSTGGFGAYAAFIPSRQVGIVLLSNKRYPNAQRVQLAYQVLEQLK